MDRYKQPNNINVSIIACIFLIVRYLFFNQSHCKGKDKNRNNNYFGKLFLLINV